MILFCTINDICVSSATKRKQFVIDLLLLCFRLGQNSHSQFYPKKNLVTKISFFLLNSKIEIHNEKWKISRLFLLFLGIRSGSGSSTANGTRNLRQSAGNSSIVSGQANSDLRKKEVVLAKISLYMVFVFLICHSVKIVPNIFEMVQTYYEARTKFSTSVFKGSNQEKEVEKKIFVCF